MTLIIFRINNVDIHFEFRFHNIIFEHFDSIKKIMNESTYFYKNIINIVFNKVVTKIKKYYSKTAKKSDILDNLIAILNLLTS